MADSVQLTDLDVITRYSIAVRTASADRDELIDTLRADLAWLERDQVRARPTRLPEPEPELEPEDEGAAYEPEADDEEPVRRAPIRRMPATVRAAPRPAARKTAVKKTAAKKAATRRTAR